ncbi:hypothetical protein [Pedobacter sp. P26]|uniref:hypothetical protein n=1 Tax=Pedobacter sp. P26 TaxID=3423956 RepID=UPI003D67FF4C
MEKFKDLHLLEGRLIGNINLMEIGRVTVELDLEEDDPGVADFSDLMLQAEVWIRTFNAEILQKLLTAIAVELTDAAYSGSDYKPVSSDYASLEQSLELNKICFYQDAVVSLIFESITEYPDMEIYCLLGESFLIDDLTVEHK